MPALLELPRDYSLTAQSVADRMRDLQRRD